MPSNSFRSQVTLLQRFRYWAVDDLRAWPKEHLDVRVVLLLAGLTAVANGWLAVTVFGLPADAADTGVHALPGWLTSYLVALFIVLLFSGAPLIVYTRYLRTLPGSVFTGIALNAIIVLTFSFMVTSRSSTAGLAIIYPFFGNYFVVGGGLGLDVLLRKRDQPAGNRAR